MFTNKYDTVLVGALNLTYYVIKTFRLSCCSHTWFYALSIVYYTKYITHINKSFLIYLKVIRFDNDLRSGRKLISF